MGTPLNNVIALNPNPAVRALRRSGEVGSFFKSSFFISRFLVSGDIAG
jgi:hypothetical protein